MNKEKMIEKLTYIRSCLPNGSSAQHECDLLIAELKAEIFNKISDKKITSFAKAARKFAKECYAKMKDTQPSIAGAFYFENNGVYKQCICDGCKVVLYTKPIEGCLEVNENTQTIDINSIYLHNENKYVKIQMPNVNEIKAAYKAKSLELNEKNPLLKVNINGIVFDAKCLIDILELVGGNVNGYMEIKKDEYMRKVSTMYIHNKLDDGNIADGILLPMRIVGDEEYLLTYNFEEM